MKYFSDVGPAIAEIKTRLQKESHADMEYSIMYYPFAKEKKQYCVSLDSTSCSVPQNEYLSLESQYDDPTLNHRDYGKTVFTINADTIKARLAFDTIKARLAFVGQITMTEFMEGEIDSWFDDSVTDEIDEKIADVMAEVERLNSSIKEEDN